MIEFEHTIFILLLLIGILNAKPPRQLLATFIILAGILLVFVPPAYEIPIPWEIILGLVIPLLLWQNIRRMLISDWQGWVSIILWGFTALTFSFALWFIGALNWPGALLFGMIVASMIWRAVEPDGEASYMSLVGTLALIILLTEVEAAIQSPNQYIGGIFSAAFFGIVTALLGLYLLRRVSPRFHSWVGLGQVYFAYWFSFAAGVSGVTAALVSLMAFVWLNQYSRLGIHGLRLATPLNSWPGFSSVLVLFLLLGWQAHQTVSTLLLVEVIVGSLIGLGIAWLGYKLKIPAFQKQNSFWLAGLRVAMLLLPALLIWPRDILQQPIQLMIALGISVLVISMSILGYYIYFPGGSHLNDIRP